MRETFLKQYIQDVYPFVDYDTDKDIVFCIGETYGFALYNLQQQLKFHSEKLLIINLN